MPNYETLLQGKMSAADQFEVRYKTWKEAPAGSFVFNIHNVLTLIAILHPDDDAFGDPAGDHLFKVTDECIEPVNIDFPRNVRRKSRKGPS